MRQTGAKTRGYDMVVGAHLTIVPNGDEAEVDLWRLKLDPNDPRPGAMTNRPGNPPVPHDRMGSYSQLAYRERQVKDQAFTGILSIAPERFGDFRPKTMVNTFLHTTCRDLRLTGKLLLATIRRLYSRPVATIQTQANVTQQ